MAVTACGGGGGSGADAPSTATGPITATVTHYDFTFDLATRAAHAQVTATVTAAGNCLALPFRATALDATTVQYDGAPAASGSLADSMLTVCGGGHAVGDTVTVAADMTVALATLSTSQVGYSVRADSDGNNFYYLVSWVNGCDQFAPCDSRPDQFATYHFTVTHDASLMVRCPGTITEDSPTQTECNFTNNGGPTYSTFGIAAYPAWTQTDEGTWGGLHVTLYDRADTGIAAAIVPAYHDGFLTWMESELGPYPFGTELRVLTAPTYWNGFEHPGNIVLADTLVKQQAHAGYANNTAHTLDHEMTHMWAGNQTTLAGTYDFAWKESMAEYLPFVYEDMQDATVSHASAATWKADAYVATHFPVPDDSPALFDYYGDVYGAGPMVLFRQLEVLTSRAQVLAAIQTALGSGTAHALSVDTLVADLATSTGLDLTAYSKAWIHGTGAPVWPRISAVFTVATSTLEVHQTNQAAGVRGCKFHVGLYGATAGQSMFVAVDTFRNGPDQSLPITAPAFAVTNTIIDPYDECLVFTSTATLTKPAPFNPWVARR